MNMRQYRVFPRQVLVVMNTGVVDDHDLSGLAGLLPGDGGRSGPRHEVGVGFGGTLLTQRASLTPPPPGKHHRL